MCCCECSVPTKPASLESVQQSTDCVYRIYVTEEKPDESESAPGILVGLVAGSCGARSTVLFCRLAAAKLKARSQAAHEQSMGDEDIAGNRKV